MNKFKRWPSLELYEELEVPYIVHGSPWGGPLWTGHCMMLDSDDSYGDAGFFHELAHWIVASPAQRQWPDFALGRHVNAKYEQVFTSNLTPHINNNTGRSAVYAERNAGWGEPTVLRRIAQSQENWACMVLWLYEPIVGLVDWDETPQEINRAASDFSGSDDVFLSVRHMKGLRRRFVEPFWSDVSVGMVTSYLVNLNE